MAVAGDSAVGGEEADIRVIRDYFSMAYNGQEKAQEEWKQTEGRHLTENLIEQLEEETGEYDQMIRAVEPPLSMLKSLRVWALKGGWYMVAYKQQGAGGWQQIPVRMVTDCDGRRKMGYVTSDKFGQAASDTLFYPKFIPMPPRQKDASAFVEAFYRSYISTKLTIDNAASGYRHALLRDYVDKSLVDVIDRRPYIKTDLIARLMDDAAPADDWRPRYKVYGTQRQGWYAIHATGTTTTGDHYIKVEKRDGHYVIAAFSDETPIKDAGGQGGYSHAPGMPPYYIGSAEGLSDYVSSAARYPEKERRLSLSARLDVAFIVEEDGSVSNIEIAGGATEGFEAEALRLISGMDGWNVAMHNDNTVRAMVCGTLVFKAQKGSTPTVEFIRRYAYGEQG